MDGKEMRVKVVVFIHLYSVGGLVRITFPTSRRLKVNTNHRPQTGREALHSHLQNVNNLVLLRKGQHRDKSVMHSVSQVIKYIVIKCLQHTRGINMPSGNICWKSQYKHRAFLDLSHTFSIHHKSLFAPDSPKSTAWRLNSFSLPHSCRFNYSSSIKSK